MSDGSWSVYLSGEIHSEWREKIAAGIEQVVDVLRYVVDGKLPG